MREFYHPEPDVTGELTALVELANVDESAPLTARESIARLHEISTRSYALAKEMGLHAISEGELTQTRAAELLKVHPITVNRWVSNLRDRTQQ